MNLDDIVLSQGAHASPDEGTCLLEVVSMLAGEPFGDTPSCVSPVLVVFGTGLNDALLPGRMDLEPRLRALAPFLVGTANRPEDDQRWGLMAADWLIRVHLPTWLHLAGLQNEAASLAESPEILSWDALPQAQITAASNAASNAAIDAAVGAVRVAVRVAVRATAWDAARATVRAAAWDVAGDATWDAARDAAWDAARAAVAEALPPAVRQLQDSALALFERMVTNI